MEKANTIRRERLSVVGQVQGVGFRPFIYRLARELQLTGWVLNDGCGVTIEVQGPAEALERFAARVGGELPPLARIERLRQEKVAPVRGEAAFEIRPSSGGELTDAQVTVDTAVCEDCLREMNDPADPRYQYPFINCTNCGPRYSIINRIPYDRPGTTMADFPMCPLCAREYADPSCRRFHAQPVACPRCGPAVWLVDTHGKQTIAEDPIHEAASMLLAGRIVAIKGLGGFHLACRADDDHAVRRLRQRKHRDAKPFAVMVADLEQARQLCDIATPAGGGWATSASDVLAGPLRPVVILPCLPGGASIAPSVAQGLATLGLMLPYTPLHHLLFARLARKGKAAPPLVMTSGNYSDEPLVKDNDAAIAHLGQIADALLLHNRRIERRIDDSVVQISPAGRPSMLRRARGYAPQPVQLPSPREVETTLPVKSLSVLAVGAELKNTFCLYRDGKAIVSEHVGDLKDGRTYRHYLETIRHLEALYELSPDVLAADMHPQYLSTEYATRRSRTESRADRPLPVIRVQHHHAHVAACLAENGRGGPVIGLACDGSGYGEDGAVWGCEIMRADLAMFERLGHLRYVPLIGGDAAATETWRPALAALYDAFGPKLQKVSLAQGLAPAAQVRTALEMIASGVNCPPTSSLGRWFDAVACLCSVASENRFEGQAPMLLEASIRPHVEDAYAFRLDEPRGKPFQIDLRPMVEGVVFDLECGVDAGVVAAKFHNTVVRLLVSAARRARETTGLGTVALSGGCFANRYVTERLVDELTAGGFEVLEHKQMPCNDGCVSLGQAVVAATRSTRRSAVGDEATR